MDFVYVWVHTKVIYPINQGLSVDFIACDPELT